MPWRMIDPGNIYEGEWKNGLSKEWESMRLVGVIYEGE